ncbi:MAG: glucosyl-3-phosphoglycerate synthase [Phycicoccus sp.]|nr:glucosyl-3-phosphoglycerate synthase [Phycicoccus sp.]
MIPLSHTDFSVDALVAAKGDQRISVVIPARDEESSVAAVVARVIADCVQAVPLVDEVVVIDSDSVDATAARARSAGAIVHAARDIRPDLGRTEGKGEALWKSQFVTSGDLLVFLDSDLVDWGTHFVSGLLGPLLADPRVQLVKAVYDRPLLTPDGHEAESGGRVTELVARPLLALHWPALAGVVQPLSGEWAVRRTAFASYAVPVGYGVEIAALLDTYLTYGKDGIAQVELGRRTHRHHRHDTLGPMAVQVMAAAESRRGLASDPAARVKVELRQFELSDEGFVPRVRQVDVAQRPPFTSVVSP